MLDINIGDEQWRSIVDRELSKEYGRRLIDYVESEYEAYTVYPPKEQVFCALELTRMSDVKVLILGQDPYHNYNQAHGLSFSVPESQEVIPPSLKNIYKELQSDCGCYIPVHGNLTKWAKQGVLMLNTILTVREHEAFSHKNKGWELFTDELLREVNKLDQPIVYMLWGAPAIKKARLLDNPKHLILTAAHPSPLSAYRGFFGCRHFSQANQFLIDNNMTPIDWQIE